MHALGHHRVFAPSLTGLGCRSHLLDSHVTLNTHISDVCNLIETEELSDITLVGHSYGGMVVTGVADRLHRRISNLLFLDAYTPSSGQSAMEIRSATSSPSDKAVTLDIPAGSQTIDPPSAEHHGLQGPVLGWANRHLKPMPLKCFKQTLPLRGDWLRVPNKVFFRAAKFPAFYFDNNYERWSADSEWTTVREEVHHNHMMMQPQWFVNLLSQTGCLS